ncbi:hypothetical protein RCG67_17145, partial [Kocuria sp. CPCC 205292]
MDRDAHGAGVAAAGPAIHLLRSVVRRTLLRTGPAGTIWSLTGFAVSCPALPEGSAVRPYAAPACIVVFAAFMQCRTGTVTRSGPAPADSRSAEPRLPGRPCRR